MNNKGQVMILKIMLAIVVLIICIAFIKPIDEAITTNTNTTLLNCSSSTLSYAEDATCTVVDMGLFYVIGALLSMSIGFITGTQKVNGVISGVVIFTIVMVLINPLKDLIIYARSADVLNCSATTLSMGQNLSCIALDIWLFWFISAIIAAGLTYMFTKGVLNDNAPKI